VKVITQKLGDRYYRKKGVVTDVIDRYGAVVKMMDSGDKLRLDQAHLETVIPALGRTVLLLSGRFRNERATLESIDESSFSCSVRLTSGPSKGLLLHNIDYENISKLDICE
jgi:DNA/RNA-binding protein KIN17